MRRNRSHPSTGVFTLGAQALLALVVCVAAVEWVAGLWVKNIREKPAVSTLSYTDEQIVKLYDTNDPARYREVANEFRRVGDTEYSPLVEYRMGAVSGRHLTITKDGYRTNGKPQDLTAPGRKVFVFGGSTTLGAGVADAETMPSYLEEVLRAAGKDVQVFNFGALAYTSTQERIAFERMLTAGTRPDVAVFMDGLDDFANCTSPDVTAWTDRLVQTTRGRTSVPLTQELVNRSNVVTLARHFGGDKALSLRDGGSLCLSETDIDKVIHRLDTNRRMIDAIGERLGVKVVFVQQPVPTYHYDTAKRPVAISDDQLGTHVNSRKGYARMAEMKAGGLLWESKLLWLAELEPAEGNAYVDSVHYSPRFNRAIAEAVASHMTDNALLP